MLGIPLRKGDDGNDVRPILIGESFSSFGEEKKLDFRTAMANAVRVNLSAVKIIVSVYNVTVNLSATSPRRYLSSSGDGIEIDTVITTASMTSTDNATKAEVEKVILSRVA